MNNFADRVREAMFERKVKLKDVAAAVGCSVQTVHKWKTGGNIEHDTLLRLSDFLAKNWLKLKYNKEELSSAVCDYNMTEDSCLEERVADERRMLSLIEALRLGVWECNLQTDQAYWSSKVWWLLTGTVKSGSWINNSKEYWMSCIVKEDLDSMNESCNMVQSSGCYRPYFARYRAKTDPNVWLISYASPSRDASRKVTRLIGHVQLEISQIERNSEFERMRGEKKGTYSAWSEVNEN